MYTTLFPINLNKQEHSGNRGTRKELPQAGVKLQLPVTRQTAAALNQQNWQKKEGTSVPYIPPHLISAATGWIVTLINLN
jgi:hypothetical protein